LPALLATRVFTLKGIHGRRSSCAAAIFLLKSNVFIDNDADGIARQSLIFLNVWEETPLKAPLPPRALELRLFLRLGRGPQGVCASPRDGWRCRRYESRRRRRRAEGRGSVAGISDECGRYVCRVEKTTLRRAPGSGLRGHGRPRRLADRSDSARKSQGCSSR